MQAAQMAGTWGVSSGLVQPHYSILTSVGSELARSKLAWPHLHERQITYLAAAQTYPNCPLLQRAEEQVLTGMLVSADSKSYLCVFSWALQAAGSENALLHSLQEKGFSPVWIRMCRLKLPVCVNSFPQSYGQRCTG